MRGEPCCGWRGVGSAFPTGTMPCACCPCRRTADASEIEPSEANPAARSEGREAACRKIPCRGLAQACESAWRCTELYRVPRRPYLIAARPPDLAFNFLRTDYGRTGGDGRSSHTKVGQFFLTFHSALRSVHC